ncbi:MAG: hypothetical protein DMG36_27240, partial [Acidobacteria bacterium]
FFLECSRVPKSPLGGVARFFPAHACVDVLGYLLLKMKLHLVIQSLNVLVATEQGLQLEPNSPSPRHDIHS